MYERYEGKRFSEISLYEECSIRYSVLYSVPCNVMYNVQYTVCSSLVFSVKLIVEEERREVFLKAWPSHFYISVK